MFGYIKVYKPELKMGEYDQYRAVYCSLCQALGKRYGFAARLMLSYDFAFLALFHMALAEEDVAFTVGHCSFCPWKKRMMCRVVEQEALAFAADTAVLLMYHKLADTVQDERFCKRLVAKAMRLLMRRDYKKACARRPVQAAAATEFMKAQATVETAKMHGLDTAADPTATLLAQFATAVLSEEDARFDTVWRFGYQLGRFVYLADAVDDLLSDSRHRRFNPFLCSETALNDEDIRERRVAAVSVLHAGVGVCAECYEQLPIHRFDGILRNVIYEGMPSIIKHICYPDEGGSLHEQSV